MLLPKLLDVYTRSRLLRPGLWGMMCSGFHVVPPVIPAARNGKPGTTHLYQTMEVFKKLADSPQTSLSESLQRAQRLVSDRVGIINKVEFEELVSGEPNVYFARSQPANLQPLCGREALNFGDAASVDPDRAIIKAIGESIERYCSAQSLEDTLRPRRRSRRADARRRPG